MHDLDRTATEALLSELEEEGRLFPGYEFCRKEGQMHLLGKGGFSVVYEMAHRRRPGERYAVKIMGLLRHRVTSDEFWRTVELQKKLSEQSPYIQKILDTREFYVFLDEEEILLQFVLMEKLENILVKDRFQRTTLAREALREEGEIGKLAGQIGQAVLTAHKNSVLHRDIKLENIFWDEREGCYKLGDFGMAKYTEEGNAETVVYTDGYGAPEIECRLEDSYDATADIYSFGITLYLLFNGLRFPGSGGYYVNMVQYHQDFVFPAPENASDEMAYVIRKMCSYHREDRYPSMSGALAAWNQAIDGKESAAGDDAAAADFATETYREEKEERERMPAVSGRTVRRRQKEAEESYEGTGVWRPVCVSLLSMMLMRGMQTDVSFVSGWQFLTLPLAVLIEAVLWQIRELHIMFGAVMVLLGVYSVYTAGFRLPHLVLLLGMLSGVPALAGAGAVGTGLWMLLVFTGGLPWLDTLCGRGLCRVVVALLLILVAADIRADLKN